MFLFEDGSTRVHVLHIKGIELADNHGKYLLTVHLRRRDLFIWVEEKQAEPVKELVDRVKQAISASLAQSSSCTHLSTKSLYKQFDHSRAGYFRSMGINSD